MPKGAHDLSLPEGAEVSAGRGGLWVHLHWHHACGGLGQVLLPLRRTAPALVRRMARLATKGKCGYSVDGNHRDTISVMKFGHLTARAGSTLRTRRGRS